jgi:eukaryotic-like serine/threonine-protein kinase
VDGGEVHVRTVHSLGGLGFFRTLTRAAEPPVRNLTGSVLSHRFKVRRLIASGGMASVYEVDHIVTHRVGALKLLQPRYARSPDAVERLIREASAAARIANPHIVDTLDAGLLESGEPYVFMELLKGESLDQALTRRGRFPMLEAIDLVVQAANGLSAAHAADVLHRDIKPANLFLLDEPSGFVKVLDFGVSKFSSLDLRTLTKEGRALGTFAYMPPEQMMGAKRVDGRADIYALGVVLYECATGQRPFKASSVPELHQRMRNNQYTPVREVVPHALYELDAFIAKSLRADPRERHASMREFHDELVALQERAVIKRTLLGIPGSPERNTPQPEPPREPIEPRDRAVPSESGESVRVPEPAVAAEAKYAKLLERDTIVPVSGIPVARKRRLFER